MMCMGVGEWVYAWVSMCKGLLENAFVIWYKIPNSHTFESLDIVRSIWWKSILEVFEICIIVAVVCLLTPLNLNTSEKYEAIEAWLLKFIQGKEGRPWKVVEHQRRCNLHRIVFSAKAKGWIKQIIFINYVINNEKSNTINISVCVYIKV